MTNPLAPIRIQFARAGNTYRLEASISRLLPRELPAVIAAFTEVWTKPEEIERTSVSKNDNHAGLAVILMADSEIVPGEHPSNIARKLTYTIWQRLDRYVKITVETTYLGESPDAHFEFGEAQYADAFGARFEQ